MQRKTYAVWLFIIAIAALPFIPAKADLRTPGWWDPDGVATGQDWHYRVPVTLPSNSSIDSTAKVNVNFATLMTQLGISGSFDANSVRIVRPGGTLATTQEYNDSIFNDATDASGNSRGEIKWIVEDGGAQTYYIYFDITQNGAKPANPQTPINANFERSATGQEDPTGWSGSRLTTAFDAQVRPNETLTITDAASRVATTNGNANTGNFSYLIGARTNADPSGTDTTILTRSITVPSTNAGNLTVRWKPQGWDSSQNSSTNYDFIRIEIVDGATVTELVGPTAQNYATRPFSPNMRTSGASATQPGYGVYNGWDMGTSGNHTAGMTVAYGAEPWWSYSTSLNSFAGKTVIIRFRTRHVSSFRSWFLIDDLEWSIVNGTLGAVEAFGVVGSTAASVAPGQILSITANVDADPVAGSAPMTANIYDDGGTLMASGITLYNDGTHGDATAGDAIWTNDGSDTGNPTYAIPLSAGTSTGWTLRIFAKDASSSIIAAANNGLVHRNGQPNAQIEGNYWNIDDYNFDVAGAALNVSKISFILSDGVSATNPKAIPGATIRYCITISNSGAAAANNISATDSVPSNISFTNGSIRSGPNCGSASTVEDDNAAGADETDTIGASITGTTISIANTTLAGSGSFAVTYDATID